jgi:hypothetical protein
MYKRGQKVETDGFNGFERFWEPAAIVKRSTAKDCARRGEVDRLADEFANGQWYVLRMSDGSAGLWTHAARIRPVPA